MDVDVDGGAGLHLLFAVGASFQVAGPLHITAELRVMEVIAPLDVDDAVTGLSGDLNSWEALGFTLGIEFRF